MCSFDRWFVDSPDKLNCAVNHSSLLWGINLGASAGRCPSLDSSLHSSRETPIPLYLFGKQLPHAAGHVELPGQHLATVSVTVAIAAAVSELGTGRIGNWEYWQLEGLASLGLSSR